MLSCECVTFCLVITTRHWIYLYMYIFNAAVYNQSGTVHQLVLGMNGFKNHLHCAVKWSLCACCYLLFTGIVIKARLLKKKKRARFITPQSVSPIKKLPSASYPYLSEGIQKENERHRKLFELITCTTAFSNSRKP